MRTFLPVRDLGAGRDLFRRVHKIRAIGAAGAQPFTIAGRLRWAGANGKGGPEAALTTAPLTDIDRSKATKGRHMPAAKKDVKATKPPKKPKVAKLPKASALVVAGPAMGDRAPTFKLTQDDGTSVALKDFKGRNLVLYFYPKADTPGCTTEAVAFSALRAAFAKTGTDILGVSADPVPAQAKFKTKHKLTIALASDESKTMLQAYGAWGEKSMYGRKFMGVIRKTFLIEGTGRIVQVWPKVSVAGHAEAVLTAAQAL